MNLFNGGRTMKKTVITAGMILMLTAVPVAAQMMGSGQHMYRQQPQETKQQQYPYCMNQGMMGSYPMGPQMMGGYGYPMGPQMMGGYGYPMGHMMGGYPMHPNMMGGYGMGHHMMGGYGMHPPCGGWQNPSFKSGEDYTKFLDETRELRRKMHNLMFDYAEAMRSQDPDQEKLQKITAEMQELREKVFSYKTK
jgi:hypothetical protein